MCVRFLALLLCIASPAPSAARQNLSIKPETDRVTSNPQQSSAKDRVEQEIQPKHMRKIFEFPAEPDPITSITATRDGSLIAYTIDRFKRPFAFGRVTTLKLWDRATGKLKTTVKDETTGGFVGLHLTPDEETVVTHDEASKPVVKLWSATTGSLLATLAGPAKRITM